MSPDADTRLKDLQHTYHSTFGEQPQFVVRAPGRVNLIGEHTDYNEGFVLPAAIDREMMIAASPTIDNQVHVYSDEYKQQDNFSLDAIEKSATHPWSDYLRGTLATLQEKGHKLVGFKAALSGNVPQGAGLSSSAAYEVAVATLVSKMCALNIPGKDVALLAQKAENEFIGVKCGIMDQFISALGQPDAALFIDCRSLDYRAVPLQLSKHGLSIVITNSGVRRGLVDSEYNARRQECMQGTELLSGLLKRKLNSLRDVSEPEFRAHEKSLPPVVAQRCRHVITENGRVERAVQSLEAGNLNTFGVLMNQSHASLRDDFQVSCKELDALVNLTQKHPGVLGARMTGAGFGGCTVAIMDANSVGSFQKEVIPDYEKESGRQAEVYVCRAVAGAGLVHAAATL